MELNIRSEWHLYCVLMEKTLFGRWYGKTGLLAGSKSVSISSTNYKGRLWIEVLNLKGETIKLTKEYVEGHLCDLSVWKDFLNKTSKKSNHKEKNNSWLWAYQNGRSLLFHEVHYEQS